MSRLTVAAILSCIALAGGCANLQAVPVRQTEAAHWKLAVRQTSGLPRILDVAARADGRTVAPSGIVIKARDRECGGGTSVTVMLPWRPQRVVVIASVSSDNEVYRVTQPYVLDDDRDEWVPQPARIALLPDDEATFASTAAVPVDQLRRLAMEYIEHNHPEWLTSASWPRWPFVVQDMGSTWELRWRMPMDMTGPVPVLQASKDPVAIIKAVRENR